MDKIIPVSPVKRQIMKRLMFHILAVIPLMTSFLGIPFFICPFMKRRKVFW